MFSRSIAIVLLGSALSAFAQTAGAESFDELAQRAESLLDSKPEESLAIYKKLLAERPAWAEGWFYLGAALYGLRRYPEARDAFEKNVPLNPQNGTAWAFLGLAQFEVGDFDHAIANIQKGEALGLGGNQDFETAVREHGSLALIRASLFDQALAQLQPLGRFHTSPPGVVEAAGLCALGDPHLPAQLGASRRAVVDLAGKAQWAATSQRPADAVAAYADLLAKYPQEPGVHYAHGLYLLETDQAAALEEFRAELKLHPEHWPSMMASGFLETSNGDPKAAVTLIERAEKLMPTGYRWLCEAEMGRAYLALGDTAKAIELFESSERREPRNAQVHYYLEQAYRRSGRKLDAQKQHAEFARLKAQQDPLSTPGGPAK